MSNQLIKQIVCSGTPRQMGEQYGEAAQAEIQTNCELFQPYWQSNQSQKAAKSLWGRLQRFYPDILVEMEGIAAAAHVDFLQVLLMNQVPLLNQEDNCTPLILRDTPDGPIIAKNNDAPLKENNPFILRKCQPAEGLPFIQLTYAGWLSGLDSMNAAGLANTHGSVGSKFACLAQGPDIRLSIYHCLKTCRTTRGLIEELQRIPCSGKGFSIAVGDATGHTAILDAAVPLLGIRAENQNFAFSTNLYMTPGLEDADLRPTAKRSVAQYRYGYLQWIATENPPRNQADIRTLLSSHEPWAPCRHGGAHQSVTNWSLLLLPAMRMVFVANGPPCCNPYIEYQL